MVNLVREKSEACTEGGMDMNRAVVTSENQDEEAECWKYQGKYLHNKNAKIVIFCVLLRFVDYLSISTSMAKRL